MRFYPRAYEYLYHAGTSTRHLEDMCLYLVPEANAHDDNAVMLHNGKTKLGNVASEQAPQIRRILAKWAAEKGTDDVVVCSVEGVGMSVDLGFYRQKPIIIVTGKVRVNERLARKFSDKFRKGE